MKPAFCEKHKGQNFTLTSPNIRSAIFDSDFGIKKIISLRIMSLEKENIYYVDSDFLDQHIDCSNITEITLYDRVKDKKKLNDRILIRKIVKDMIYVCPICFQEFLKRHDSSTVVS